MIHPQGMRRRWSQGPRMLKAGASAGAVIIGLVLAGVTQAQVPVLPPSVVPDGERHVAVIPEGWQAVHQSVANGLETRSYVPPGQSAESWQDMLTVQVVRLSSGKPAPAPDQLYAQTRSSYEQACDGVRLGELQNGRSNGYPSAFWVLGCARIKTGGYGEAAFFRIVQGNAALYIVQRAWRLPPFDRTQGPPLPPDQQKQALEILQRFTVCDPSRKEHPCPAGR